MRAGWIALATACYGPHPQPGSPCGPGEPCPAPLVCSTATLTCQTTGALADAAIDSPGNGLDAAAACFGASSWRVCVSSAPASPVTIGGDLDTDTSALCSSTASWATTQQPAACFVVGTAVTVNAATTVHGTRPLVLLGSKSIAVIALLDASSHVGGVVGAAADASQCSAFVASPGTSGGGAGGSFTTTGGNGGTGLNGARGVAASADAQPPVVLRGGCAGQLGGAGFGGAGAPGHGGGAVYLVAGESISVRAEIAASGAGGLGGGGSAGGGGGGAGGMIRLFAPTIDATAAAYLSANGGGGGAGAGLVATGGDGADPDPSRPLLAAPGGPSSSSAGEGGGGSGFAGTNNATAGANSNSAGGGGGGGAGGIVEANHAMPNATISPLLVIAP